MSRIHITERDLQVMDTLHRYQIVREATLHALHFPDAKYQRNVQSTLKRLADHRYIGRRFLPSVHRLNTDFLDYTHQDRSGAVYFLAQDGAALLGRGHNPNTAKVRLSFLHHRLDIADIRASFEMAIRSHSDTKLAHWIDENDRDEEGRFLLHDQVTVEDKNPGTTRQLPIRPDACVILEHAPTSKQELFFLEMDEGTESVRKRWADKVSAYRTYARQDFSNRHRFNGQGFRVLCVTRTPSGREQEQRLDNLVHATRDARGSKQFWFATFGDVMPEQKPVAGHILDSPIWTRADPSQRETRPALTLAGHLFGRDLGIG